MNILIISQYYYPEQFLVNDIATGLVNRGHSVTILTGLPNYPTGRVPKEYKCFRRRQEKINGVNVIRCFEIGRRNSKYFLLLNYISYALSASTKTFFMKNRYDVVFCYQLSPITMGLPAIIYKKRKDVKFLLYCLDIWPESVKSYIKNENSFLYKIIRKISNYIYNGADFIACTSEPFMDYLNYTHGINRGKLIYMPQHGDSNFLKMDLRRERSNCFNFMFAGHIGIGQDIDCIINAVELLDDVKDFRVHLVGDGSYLNQCKHLIKEKRLEDKFILHGRVNMADMPKLYKIADVCIITLKNTSKVGHTIPGKLQTYMAAGKPIIGAINGATLNIIKNASCGFCVNSGDYFGLAHIMKKIMQSDSIETMGKNAKSYFESNFTLNIYLDALENNLRHLMR